MQELGQIMNSTTANFPARNTFQQTLLGLTFNDPYDNPGDLFSQACVEQYLSADFSQFGFRFSQVFEPDVLREVSVLEGIPYSSVTNLSWRGTTPISDLAYALEHMSELSVVELVNVAAAFISVSRFAAASRVLKQASLRSTSARERFEIAMLQFVIFNRLDDATLIQRSFVGMRQAIESDLIPDDRILDACSQAVVWYIKRKALEEQDFNWYLARGRALLDNQAGVKAAGVSSWYRALAMVPAAKGDTAATRQYMASARDAAESAISEQPGAYEMHLRKTYYESSLKEHMYVTKNFSRAEESGRALIALDPLWSPSYGELAEAFSFFKHPAEAVLLYEQAIILGPPYVAHHRIAAAKCHYQLGNTARALEHYKQLAELAPDNIRIMAEGRDLAEEAGDHSSFVYFSESESRLRDQESNAASNPSAVVR